MSEWFNSFLLTFIPLFIVVDSLGSLLFLEKACGNISKNEYRKIANTSVITALIVGLAFLFLGRLILSAMRIDVGSFIIAGGIILIILSINYLITGHSVEYDREELVAIVPLGTPLLAGPATITALLILSTQHPLYIVLISFLLNLLIAWGIFLGKDKIIGFTGKGGLKAISNVFNLLLAAIAVSMVLHGLTLLGIIKGQ
jgi:multiple antibiotic resistance protein